MFELRNKLLSAGLLEYFAGGRIPSGLSDLLKIREPLLILAWKNSANRLTSRKISGIRLYWTDKNSMIYYYIMHACSKPEQYGQARFVEKVNIHAASANSRSSACKIAFALQMQKSRGVYRAARPRNRARTALTFFISGGRKFLHWNFRTTLERPAVRSCLSAKL